MFSENEKVITLVEKDGYAKGTIGIIVSKYENADVYEVEVWDSSNYPADVVTYKGDELKNKI